MFKHFCGFALLVAAITAAAAGRLPDPADAGAAVPPVVHQSAFKGYRPNVEQPVGAWRELNDEVGRVGGWRTYAREAREPAPPGAQPASAPVLPSPANHKHP